MMTLLQEELEAVKKCPEYKRVLRVLIKYQIQLLCQKLSDVGEESFLVTASIPDGTVGNIGSSKGEQYLHNLSNIDWNFLHFCRNSGTYDHHGTVLQNAEMMSADNSFKDPGKAAAQTLPDPAVETEQQHRQLPAWESCPEYSVSAIQHLPLRYRKSDKARRHKKATTLLRESPNHTVITDRHCNSAVTIKSEPIDLVDSDSEEICSEVRGCEGHLVAVETPAFDLPGGIEKPGISLDAGHSDPQEYETGSCEKVSESSKTVKEEDDTNITADDMQEDLRREMYMQNFTLPTGILNFSANDGAEDLKMFQCQLCNVVFNRPDQLTIHLREHIGTDPDSNSQYWTCPVCQQPYQNFSQLTMHLRIHSGERPYKCADCPKTYTYSCNLRSHMRTHRGEKPFQCHLCSASFSYKHHLAQHRFSHTGEKPYQCTMCHKSFTRLSNLKMHFRIHHHAGETC